MALTATDPTSLPGGDPVGRLRIVLATLTFDSSYPTGGEALTVATLGYPGATVRFANIAPAAGYVFEWDYTNLTVLAKTPVKIYTATHDPANLAAATSANESVTVTGVAATDKVVAVWMPAAAEAGVVVQAARPSGANTVTVRLTNPSAGAVNVTSGTFDVYTVAANGAAQEVANTTDLSAVATRGIFLLEGV